ncbi:MAG: UvrB domain 3-containing protein, partial [Microgenomates group bacterium]
LTGFDAPILYAIYLDKPMNDHAFLQAIARVNRPMAGKEFHNPKTTGLIVDFVGIFEKLERALRFDSVNIEGAIIDLEKIKQDFVNLLNSGRKYLEIVGKKIDDKAVELVVEYFTERANRKEFLNLYRELEQKYEIIAPDTFLRPYLEEYFLLSGIYKILRTHFVPKINQGLLRKTIQLIREKAEVVGIERTLPLYPIDKRTIQLIQEDSSPERLKIIKIHRSVMMLIDDEGKKEPFLLLFRERLEKILEEFENRQIGTKETLKKFEQLIEEINQARVEKERLKMDGEHFAIYWVLSDSVKDENQRKEKAESLTQLFREYIAWRENPEIGHELRRRAFAVLYSATGTSEKSLEKMNQIFQLES